MSENVISRAEARALLANTEGATEYQYYRDYAHTVVVQAEQIAAALALHTGSHDCGGVFYYADDESGYRHCPTARTLGVEP